MLRKYFTAGPLLGLPLGITLWLLESLIHWSDVILTFIPVKYHPETLFGHSIPGFGLIVGALMIVLTGLFVTNFLGRRLVALWEDILNHIPVLRSVYQGVKQIAGTILSSDSNSFKEVVLVEFPQPGQWTFAFVVASPDESVKAALDEDDLLTLFIPTAPNPTSGFVVMMNKNRIKYVDVTVEQALKYHLSLGVMAPKKDTLEAN